MQTDLGLLQYRQPRIVRGAPATQYTTRIKAEQQLQNPHWVDGGSCGSSGKPQQRRAQGPSPARQTAGASPPTKQRFVGLSVVIAGIRARGVRWLENPASKTGPQPNMPPQKIVCAMPTPPGARTRPLRIRGRSGSSLLFRHARQV